MPDVERSDDELLRDFWSDTDHGNSQLTADRYTQNVEHFAEWLRSERDKRLIEAGTRDAQTHLQELEDGSGNKTVHARYTAISVFYGWLDEEGVIADDPTETLESGVDPETTRKEVALRSDTPPAVTHQEKEQLCEHVPSPEVRNELMIRLMFQTGVREKELRNIRVSDLDREEREITVEEAKTEGGGTEFRTVYWNDLEPWLTLWLDGGRRDGMRPADESPYLFITNRSEKMARDRPNKIIKTAAENAGIQSTMYTDGNGNERHRITSHALRHGFARYCVKDGMDISFLQELMGHDNLDTTKQYLAFTDDDKRDAVSRHGPRPDA